MYTVQKNPMLIDVIVDHLFKVIPFNYEDFKNFRLVSKLFWKSSLSTWRQNAWLSVNGRIYRSNNSCPYIEGYLDMLGAPGDPYQLLGKCSFKKYKLEAWEFKLGAGDRAILKKVDFWSKVGDDVTHLQCSNSVFHTREDFQLVLFEIMPNLQFLSLTSNVYKCGQPPSPGFYRNAPPVWDESIKPSPLEIRRNLSQVEIGLEFKMGKKTDFPVCWMQFFAHFPNIKVLKLKNLCPTNPKHAYKELTKLFQCVEMLRDKCDPQILAQLEELDILSVRLRAIERLPHRFTTHLRNLAFPLKSLALDIGFDDFMSEEKFKETLEIHSSTLERLVVYRGPYKEEEFDINVSFNVHLPQLTELRLIGVICDGDNNLSFLKHTPNLKTLVLLNGVNANDNAMGMLKDDEDFSLRHLHQKKVPNLRPVDPYFLFEGFFAGAEKERIVFPKLEVFIANLLLCDEDIIKGLARLMPNLRSLGLGLMNGCFREICKKFKNLEALHISPFKVSENEMLGVRYGEKYRLPNITDLKRLKYFSMGRGRFDDPLSIGVLLHGLLAHPSLEGLDVKLMHKDTKDVEVALAKFPRLNSKICYDDYESTDSSSESESSSSSSEGTIDSDLSSTESSSETDSSADTEESEDV